MALANPDSELDQLLKKPEAIDVIVIGSGYGAGICAARFAEAKATVVVLERGKEFSSAGKEFPDSAQKIRDNVQIDGGPFGRKHRLGLYNFHTSRDLDVLVGCGLGGTSLINANVSIEPDPRVFDRDVWPKRIRDEARDRTLMRYYDRARAVLDPKPFPRKAKPVPRKLQAMEANGGTRCEINVHFKGAGPANSIGVAQRGCENCGDCVTGCNFEAKKTLCYTYLPLAKAFGAKIFVQCDVQYVTQREDGLWEVNFQRLVDGTEDVQAPDVLIAKHVVVAAGVMGTTGILLRSKARGLPISDELGGRVSGNGDALAMAYNCDPRLDSVGYGQAVDDANPVGPTILGVIDRRDGKDLDDGIIIEEGAFPSGMARLLRVLVQAIAGYTGSETQHGFRHWFHERLEEGRDLFGDTREGALNRTLLFLLMGHDGADGVIELDDHQRPIVRWPQLHEREIFSAENELAKLITSKLGGIFVSDPLDTKLFLNNLITVHPLGGCPMGDDPRNAVVDDCGRVYNDKGDGSKLAGLYVADASVIPTSLGVNPLLTISALAERIAEHVTREDLKREPKASVKLPSAGAQ